MGAAVHPGCWSVKLGLWQVPASWSVPMVDVCVLALCELLLYWIQPMPPPMVRAQQLHVCARVPAHRLKNHEAAGCPGASCCVWCAGRSESCGEPGMTPVQSLEASEWLLLGMWCLGLSKFLLDCMTTKPIAVFRPAQCALELGLSYRSRPV